MKTPDWYTEYFAEIGQEAANKKEYLNARLAYGIADIFDSMTKHNNNKLNVYCFEEEELAYICRKLLIKGHNITEFEEELYEN